MPNLFRIQMLAIGLAAWTSCGFAIEIETACPFDPEFPAVPTRVVFDSRLTNLWLQALSRPEIDLKRQAADAIATACRFGFSGHEAAIPALTAELEAPQSHRLVRLSAARALIALDARETAHALMKYSLQDGWEMAEIVEPALARWKHAPMRDVWLQRLSDPSTRPRQLLLAIQAADTFPLPAASPALQTLILDRDRAIPIRLAAARALAKLQHSGLENTAEKLGREGGRRYVAERLAAAELLSMHTGERAEKLLLVLAEDAEPAVQAVALRRLLTLNPAGIEPLAQKILASPDANVRFVAAEIFRAQQTVAAVQRLGELLIDADPLVRNVAQESLIALDRRDDLQSVVRELATRHLAGDHPPGIEQAELVLGAVDHEPAADRLLELLHHKTSAVSVTAAWALRRLSVPRTAQSILEKVRADTEKSTIPLPLGTPVDMIAVNALYQQQEHLLEALGLMRYRAAEETLLLYLPKPPLRPDPVPDIRLDTVWINSLRVRSVWALGHLFENDPPEHIVSELVQRMNDTDSEEVRAMAAISLGRMGAKTALPHLKKHFVSGGDYSILSYGCAWSVARLTGEPLVPFHIKPRLEGRAGWFLEPLK